MNLSKFLFLLGFIGVFFLVLYNSPKSLPRCFFFVVAPVNCSSQQFFGVLSGFLIVSDCSRDFYQSSSQEFYQDFFMGSQQGYPPEFLPEFLAQFVTAVIPKLIQSSFRNFHYRFCVILAEVLPESFSVFLMDFTRSFFRDLSYRFSKFLLECL